MLHEGSHPLAVPHTMGVIAPSAVPAVSDATFYTLVGLGGFAGACRNNPLFTIASGVATAKTAPDLRGRHGLSDRFNFDIPQRQSWRPHYTMRKRSSPRCEGSWRFGRYFLQESQGKSEAARCTLHAATTKAATTTVEACQRDSVHIL